jgi:hypothetical protein
MTATVPLALLATYANLPSGRIAIAGTAQRVTTHPKVGSVRRYRQCLRRKLDRYCFGYRPVGDRNYLNATRTNVNKACVERLAIRRNRQTSSGLIAGQGKVGAELIGAGVNYGYAARDRNIDKVIVRTAN